MGITAALSLVWLEVMAGRCPPGKDWVKVAGDLTTTMGVRNGRGLVAGVERSMKVAGDSTTTEGKRDGGGLVAGV